MTKRDYLEILPRQYTGEEIVADSSVVLGADHDAIELFETAAERLRQVKNWHQLAGITSAEFKVFDADGNAADRPVQQGDFLRVDVPGPGSTAGNGYDWVQVEQLRRYSGENVDSIGFRVRPTANPTTNSDDIAHFYSVESTSSFMITREGNTVTATIVDRNTKPNTTSAHLVDTIRHLPVASAAIAWLSKMQWQQLANGLIDSKAGST